MITRIGALLRVGIDWEYLLQTAHMHGIVPLLYWHLDAVHSDIVPESVFKYLRSHFCANSLRNLSLTGELLRILAVFEERGIPAASYKGPTLASSVYGNLALRQFIDLDIVIHREDVSKAKEALASLGYRPQYQLTRAQEAAFLRSHCECAFTRGDGESAVDLHWDTTELFPFLLDTTRVWERLVSVPLGGNLVLTLSPEDTLLVLCAHGAKHLWERLGWICDVAELVRTHRENMRWEQVMMQASALGGERILLLGLFLASHLLGASLPGEVLQRVHAEPTVKALAGQIYEQLFRAADGPASVFEEAYFRPLHLKMQKRWRDKIRYCARIVTVQRVEDWKLLPLPTFLFPFYYMLRPIRLISKYGRRLLQRVS